MNNKRIPPMLWIPSLYFAEALPYVTVMSIATIMYKQMNLTNTEIALYTGWLYLPWVIKPLWSPIVDLLSTKRKWVLWMQGIMCVSLAMVGFSLPTSQFLQWSLVAFWITAFCSATHDIAADGYYMLELDTHEQAVYVGVRSTFYRIASILGQGGLVMLAGYLEETHLVTEAWSFTFFVMSAFFLAACVYHSAFLPKAVRDVERTPGDGRTVGRLLTDFGDTFVSFFRKEQTWAALLFMLLYRLPEALLVKMSNLFLMDAPEKGGLGLSPLDIGWVQGTVGVIGLTVGGIVGGFVVGHGGLKRWLWPMVACITVPDLVYVYLSYLNTASMWIITSCVCLEQLGYGFGFTAYMLYLVYYAQGERQTAHYALCTGLMALGMMLPGMVSGWLQESVGYRTFFLIVMACCLVTVGVSALLRIDPEFGKKQKKR
jgi:PAT family beta-lactamase induction signal transducer AmpG